ncbi:hypothetical protein Nepgr_022805 [Nepenthes gracilis]|uniref:Uncharacterized protein n=1 Tax=Nepenthes gracilis TaxID=150966 RepID=A0AAD3T0Z1_NEPGR|nr:hypothetical protein Nepgr_022805 [Nepenthes gracilis]
MFKDHAKDSTPLQITNYSSDDSFQGFPPDQLPSAWIQEIKHATEYINRHQRQQKTPQQLFTAFLFNQQQKRKNQFAYNIAGSTKPSNIPAAISAPNSAAQ